MNFSQLGKRADRRDQSAVEELDALARTHGIEPDDYDTWAEVADLLHESDQSVEGPPPVSPHLTPGAPRYLKGLKEVYLISEKGTRIAVSTRCDECKAKHSPVWRYVKSNLGTVHLCSSCKPEVFDRSFGMKDALDSSSGGGFEANRKRH